MDVRLTTVMVGCGLVASACKFDPPPDVPGDVDAAAADATPVDAAACEAGTVSCEAGRYVECGPDGLPVAEMNCPIGCAIDEAKCVDIDPSNGLAGFLDQARSDPAAPIVTFGGSSTIDASTGEVRNGRDLVAVPHEFHDGMRVFMFRELTVNGTLKVTGDAPIALVVAEDVSIVGLLDVSADGATPGPGGIVAGDCVGHGGTFNIGPASGGGGGGRYEPGGRGGGEEQLGGTGNPGGTVLRDDDVSPLVGGCSGGTLTQIPPGGGSPIVARGGGGGGAVQIVSGSRIEVVGAGKIDASGGGGQPASGAGGGGTGGAILLEAPEVVLDGNQVVLSTKGGGGAAPVENGAGQDGGTSAGVAAGGSNLTGAEGGHGGNETLSPAMGQDGTGTGWGAGGGGSVGQVRLNTATGTIEPQNGATIRSRWSTGGVRTRRVP